MGYTNSSLVAYTKLSPNNSGQRNHSIDRITPHCVVGQCTAEGPGNWLYSRLGDLAGKVTAAIGGTTRIGSLVGTWVPAFRVASSELP